MILRLSTAFVLVALVVPVAAALSDRSWVASMGLEVLGGSHHREAAALETLEVSRELDDQSLEVRQRIDVKSAIIHNLIVGRTTLAEVTSLFIAMDEDRPAYMDVLRKTQSGATDEEKMMHNILNYVVPYLRGESLSYSTVVMSRLVVQYHHLTSEAIESGIR